MPRSYALLVPLLAAASLCILCAAAPESSDNADEAFDKTHSANGAAVGTLSWNGKGTGTEKKIGELGRCWETAVCNLCIHISSTE